jgi:hypothetical protein
MRKERVEATLVFGYFRCAMTDINNMQRLVVHPPAFSEKLRSFASKMFWNNNFPIRIIVRFDIEVRIFIIAANRTNSRVHWASLFVLVIILDHLFIIK